MAIIAMCIIVLVLSLRGQSEKIKISNVSLESHHVVLEIIDGELLVKNAILVNIWKDTENLQFSIPENIQDIEIISGLDDDSITKEEGRLIDLRKITEGTKRIVFNYHLKIKENRTNLPIEVFYETKNFFFLAKNLELSVESNQLVSEGILAMGDKNYIALSGTDLTRGEKIEITVGGLGKRGRRKTVLMIVPVVFIILLILLIFVVSKGRSGKKIIPKETNLSDKKKALVIILATLDEKFGDGEISKGVYRELRDELKEKLRQVKGEIEERK